MPLSATATVACSRRQSSAADDVRGEVVVGYVVERPGIGVTVDELHAVRAERLAKYKRPALIEVLDELPKNAVGKIDKPALRDRAAA